MRETYTSSGAWNHRSSRILGRSLVGERLLVLHIRDQVPSVCGFVLTIPLWDAH